MTAIDATEANGWTRVLQQRQSGWMQRVAVSSAAAIIFSPILGFHQTLPWLAVFMAVQVVEHLVLSPVASGRSQSTSRMAVGMIALMLSGAAFGALSIPLWLTGGVMGGLCATAMLCGGALYSSLYSAGSLRALIATAGPQYLYLCLGAAFMSRMGAPSAYVVATLVCGVTFSLYCLWTWRTMNDAHHAETASRLEAQRRREEAERRMGAQSAFLAAVGHDLRTPISAILTGAAELERDATGSTDGRARTKAALITEAGLMMKAMLDDLLDQAKLDAGRMTVDREPMELRRLLCQTARFWRPAVSGKGLNLRIDAGRQTPDWILGDAMRLRQILNNLVSNALKFTEAGHIGIRVRCWPEDDGRLALLIDIEDSGPGMTDEQLARLFTAFDQTDNSVTVRHGGTGLGLSISRDLAALMGGRLTARSAPGRGAVFTLSLTVDRAEPVARAVDPFAGIDQRAAVARAFNPVKLAPPMPSPAVEPAEIENAATPDEAPASEPEEEERALRVLIVDDHEINRRAIQLILAPFGAESVQAADGMAALAAAEAEPFDVIFMDVRMPELDGRETTRRLRAGTSLNRSTPVIAVTADSAAEDVAACKAAGMDLFVSKPLTPGSLLGALTEALSAREAAQSDLETEAA